MVVRAGLPIILAHRAYRDGCDPASENSLTAVEVCLRQGWGVEIDIRRSDDGQFYVSHDRTDHSDLNDAGIFCCAIRDLARVPVALNVKELGYERELLDLLARNQLLAKVFLFDMELIEETPGEAAHLFRCLSSEVQVAVRVSDRREPVNRVLQPGMPKIVWLDEFDSLWVTREDIEALKLGSKRIYVISPEIHGFAEEQMMQRWRDFSEWGVDGICTDYPARLDACLGSGTFEVPSVPGDKPPVSS